MVTSPSPDPDAPQVTSPDAVGEVLPGGADDTSITDLVAEPAKVMRIGRMISRLLDEVRQAPLDDPSRTRLREIYTQSIAELSSGLAPELADELRRVTRPFDETTPSDAELRIAQAQLVGWLEGLFQGLQTALVAQQMAANAQVEQMRRTLPGRPEVPGTPGHPDGMYL